MEGIDKIRGVRIEKLHELVASGTNPYPYNYKVSHKTSEVVTDEAALSKSEERITIAGRIMALRGHGA